MVGRRSLRQDGGYDLLRKLSFGISHVKDIQKILGKRIEVVFDVGANDGQSVRTFLPAFPFATIYSFEPDPKTFQRLELLLGRQSRVRPVCRALGSSSGTAQLFRFNLDQTNSLLPKAEGAEQYVFDKNYLKSQGTVSVPITTIDDFCAMESIRRIDLLKIDTQGFEIEVLQGAKALLSQGAIAMIYTEVSFVSYYGGQPLFHEVYEFLYRADYRLVGLYESGFLTHHYQVGGNALFVHSSLGSVREQQPRLSVGSVRVCW